MNISIAVTFSLVVIVGILYFCLPYSGTDILLIDYFFITLIVWSFFSCLLWDLIYLKFIHKMNEKSIKHNRNFVRIIFTLFRLITVPVILTIIFMIFTVTFKIYFSHGGEFYIVIFLCCFISSIIHMTMKEINFKHKLKKKCLNRE